MALGAVTALCAVGWFLSLAMTMFEVHRVADDAPPFYPGIIMVIGLVVTLPPALICTAIAVFLVGPRRSKLSWISLCVYLLPVVIIVVGALMRRLSGDL